MIKLHGVSDGNNTLYFKLERSRKAVDLVDSCLHTALKNVYFCLVDRLTGPSKNSDKETFQLPKSEAHYAFENETIFGDIIIGTNSIHFILRGKLPVPLKQKLKKLVFAKAKFARIK